MAESEMASLPGFRFHPTDEELVNFYLRRKNFGDESAVKHAINEIDIYKFDPWDLPGQSKLPTDDRVWFYFCPRVGKFSNSKRTSRTTRIGYWKGTGVDRKIRAKKNGNVVIGTKKTLVFYLGRVPNGQRTDWVMHEYQSTLPGPEQIRFVLCKVKDKTGEKTGTSSCNGSDSSYSLVLESNNLAAINTDFEVNEPVQETQSFPEHGLSVSELDRLTGTDPEFLKAVRPSEQERLSLAELECPNGSTSDYNVQWPSDFSTKAEPEFLNAVRPSRQEGLYLVELERPNEITSDYNVQRPSDLSTEADRKFLNELEHVDRRFVEELFADQDDFILQTSVYERFNTYRQPQSVMGVCEGYSSDSDAETISAGSYPETSSPGDSVGSSKEYNQIPVSGFHGTQTDGSEDSLSSTNTGMSRYESKNTNDVDDHPTRIQFQGKAMHSEAPIKVIEAADPDNTDEVSKYKKPAIMAREAGKETSTTINRKEKGSYVLMEMVEICRKPDQLFVALLTVVAGSILFVVTSRGIFSLH